MLPKSGLACLFLLSCLGTILPAFSQAATDFGVTRIANMETKIFAHPYNSEVLPQRVARLERFVYGGESKDPLENRIARLIDNVPAKSVTVNGAPAKATFESVRTKTMTAVTTYPRVTELEQQLLERTYENDVVAVRVARLEAKVFGRVWLQQADLAIRVDRLGEYAYMNPQVEELEKAEFLRVSMLRHVVHQEPQPKRVTITVVDEIESLETMTFGKISASKPLGQRVDALEFTLCGATQTDKQQNLTTRVAILLSKVNNALPNRLGV